MTMAYNVKIKNTPYHFTVDAGESLLQAALRQDIPVPWGCGGGVCGVCMSQLVSGTLSYPDGDPLALFEEDAADGKCLLRVGYPQSDVVLEVPEMGENWEPFA